MHWKQQAAAHRLNVKHTQASLCVSVPIPVYTPANTTRRCAAFICLTNFALSLNFFFLLIFVDITILDSLYQQI